MWYWWDLIQIVKDGSKIRKDGLNSPFDWIRGIGRGVFTPLEQKEGEPLYVSKRSYLIYAFLAVFFGWLGADKFYIGEFLQGCAKLFSCFNIFIFLFGWLWVLWDSFHAIFLLNNVLKDGISPPIPYSMLFPESTNGDMFLVNHIYDKSEDSVGILDWVAKTFQFPSVPVFPWKTMYNELVVPFMTPQLVKAIQGVKGGVTFPVSEPPIIPPVSSVITTLGDIARDSPSSMLTRSVIAPETIDGRSSMEQRMAGDIQPTMPSMASLAPSLPTVASLPTPASLASSLPTPASLATSLPTPASLATSLPTAASLAPSLPTPASLASSLPTPASLAPSLPTGLKTSGVATPKTITQHGGGQPESGPGPVIAGTLTALVIAGGLKGFYDVISKQYG